MDVPVLTVRVDAADFDVGQEIAQLRHAHPGVGAVVSFVGTVRELHPGADDPASGLVLEHYPGMTERSIEAMAQTLVARHQLKGVTVVHRVGRLMQGEQIVLVLVAASHRREAFMACECLMDWLKGEAPLWKKEFDRDGERWVMANDRDTQALARWGVRIGAAQ